MRGEAKEALPSSSSSSSSSAAASISRFEDEDRYAEDEDDYAVSTLFPILSPLQSPLTWPEDCGYIDLTLIFQNLSSC